jgi:ribose/xylose/arabinose/galactoside ABC-type transport system permease subunit
MTVLITIAVSLLIGAILGVFIYRNNLSLFNPTLSKIDGAWDKAEMTDKIKELEAEIKEILKNK